MGKIKDWIEAKKAKKAEDNAWKEEIKKEALSEAREEIKNDLKRKYIDEEKERLKSGSKSKFLSTLSKEFGALGDKMSKNLGDEFKKKDVKSNEESNPINSDKISKMLSESPTPIKDFDANKISGMDNSKNIINDDKIKSMLGESLNTKNPHDKIGNTDFREGIDRGLRNFKRKKE